MAYKDEYLCCVLYSPAIKTKRWVRSYHQIVLKYSGEVGVEITHFDFEKNNGNKKQGGYRYIKRNEKYLSHDNVDNTLRALYFIGADEKSVAPYPRFETVLRKMEENVYVVLYLEVLVSLLIKQKNSTNYIRNFIKDVQSISEFTCGFTCTMKGKMFPLVYFVANMATSVNNTPDEEKAVRIWQKEGHRFQSIVRDIYWGNVISKSHWNNDKEKEKYLLKALDYECKGNVSWIDDKTIFFCAPFDICPQDNSRMRKFKERLYIVFDKCEIEVIGANLDNYAEPQIESKINLRPEDAPQKPKRLRSKKRLIIRYLMIQDTKLTREHEYITEILTQAGPLPLIIKPEEKQDGRWSEITVDGKKVPQVRKEIISCINTMDLNIEINPPVDEKDFQ